MMDRGTLWIEQKLGPRLRADWRPWVAEFALFWVKQAWSAAFSIAFLLAITISTLIWNPDWALARYDALFLVAIALQVSFIYFRLEHWEEVKVIFLFHITGTVMEIYKLAHGSWDYPENGMMELGGVPLFSGFMYACVGSYIARVIRIFDMKFAPYPPFWMTALLAGLIYLNFFTHHYLPDIRLALFAATIALFWRTRIWFFPVSAPRWMPLPLAALLSALFIWAAENVGTFTRTWAYPGQGQFELVSFSMLGSWYLLLYVSFVTVTLVMRDQLLAHPIRPAPREVYRAAPATSG